MSSPLAKFKQHNQLRWETLVDFPDWEKNSILNWIHALLCPEDQWGRKSYEYTILTTIQSNERIMIQRDLGLPIGNWSDLNARLSLMIESDDPQEIEMIVIFLELLVKYVRDSSSYYNFGKSKGLISSAAILNGLEAILGNGSKWTIIESEGATSGLIERINPELMEIAKNSNNSDLFEAWGYAYGANPNPELAIAHAQSAIEHIASKTGLTNATSKVYGSLLGDIKTHKGKIYKSIAKTEFDKTLSLAKQSGLALDNQFAEWFSSGMDLIQKSNPSRHKSTETEGFTVDVGAARQAVLIATSLYEIIEKKYIYKAA